MLLKMDAGPYTVLLIDDFEGDRRLGERILLRGGYRVVLAANGQDGVEKAVESRPAVIVMDVLMPVMDGREAARRLREHPATAGIPILMVSAFSSEDDLASGLDAGADEYITKPLRPREFLLRIRSLIRLRESQLTIERTNAKLQRRTEILSALHRFHEQAAGVDSFERACRCTVETAAELLKSDEVALLMPDRTGQRFEFVEAIGMPDALWRGVEIGLDHPIAARVYATRQELVLANAHPLGWQLTGESIDGGRVVPLISIPLRSTNGVVGALTITRRRDGGDYDQEDLEVARQLAETAGLVLDNALTRKKLDETRDSIILSLARLSEYRHAETGRHLERVRALSMALAEYLARDPRIPDRIDAAYISDLGRAAPLHDIGKVAIPDCILLKRGQLTREEFTLIKEHTIIGAETLRSVISSGHEISFLQMAMDVARHHHERWDGTGYPDGLSGEDIPLCARIVGLADAYDAIRMPREYKPARSHEDATREILKGSGGQFDPRIVQAFCALEATFSRIYHESAEESHAQPGLAAVAATQVPA